MSRDHLGGMAAGDSDAVVQTHVPVDRAGSTRHPRHSTRKGVLTVATGGCVIVAAMLVASRDAVAQPAATGRGRAGPRDSAALVAVARAALERRAGHIPRHVVAIVRDSAGTVVEFFPDCPRRPRRVCSDGGGRVRVGRDGRVVVLAAR